MIWCVGCVVFVVDLIIFRIVEDIIEVVVVENGFVLCKEECDNFCKMVENLLMMKNG